MQKLSHTIYCPLINDYGKLQLHYQFEIDNGNEKK